MSKAPATFERLQEICTQYDCLVQDLFLVGDQAYVACGDCDARSYPRNYQPIVLDDLQLSRALPELLRRLDAKVYGSLDELREQHVQGDEFYAIYDVLYDSLTEYGNGTAPDGEPLYLPAGYQGGADIQLHVSSHDLLTPALIERVQAPLSKFQRRWKVYVTAGDGDQMRTIAEIYSDAVHAR